MASVKFDLRNKLDNDMFNHVVYVANRILMSAKTSGLSGETLEQAGKLLWRLFNVMQAYNAKRRDVTLDSIVQVVSDFHKVFTG